MAQFPDNQEKGLPLPTFGMPSDLAASVPWRVTSIGAAEWAMRQVVRAKAAIDGADAQYREWVAQLDAWLGLATRRDRETIERMSGPLTQYALEQRAIDPARKTLNLPSGKVSTVLTAPRVEVVDEDLLLGWIDTMPPEDQRVMTRRHPLVSRLRYEVVTVPSRVTLSCGNVVIPDTFWVHRVTDDGTMEPWPWEVGIGVHCNDCDSWVLVAQLHGELRKVIVDPAHPDYEIPGVALTEAKTTASVKPNVTEAIHEATSRAAFGNDDPYEEPVYGDLALMSGES